MKRFKRLVGVRLEDIEAAWLEKETKRTNHTPSIVFRDLIREKIAFEATFTKPPASPAAAKPTYAGKTLEDWKKEVPELAK